MSPISPGRKNTVPVGATPVPKYGTWDEHREAMHRDAADLRMRAERRRIKNVANRRLSK